MLRVYLIPVLIGAVIAWVFMEDYLKKQDMGDPKVFAQRARIAGIWLVLTLAYLLIDYFFLYFAFGRTLALLAFGVALMSLIYMGIVHQRRKNF